MLKYFLKKENNLCLWINWIPKVSFNEDKRKTNLIIRRCVYKMKIPRAHASLTLTIYENQRLIINDY